MLKKQPTGPLKRAAQACDPPTETVHTPPSGKR